MISEDPAQAFEWIYGSFPGTTSLQNFVALSMSTIGAVETVKLLDNPPAGIDREHLVSALYQAARFPRMVNLAEPSKRSRSWTLIRRESVCSKSSSASTRVLIPQLRSNS